jgi:Family of unknown function (DUF6011)
MRSHYEYLEHDGETLFGVRIGSDGSLDFPPNYSEETVRAAIARADERIRAHEERARHTNRKWSWWYLQDERRTSYARIGINEDGSLYNPNGYPEEIIRPLVDRAVERKKQELIESRKQAVEKRQWREQLRVYTAAKYIQEERSLGPRDSCYVCRKRLKDPPSIARGIGPECWERHVLRTIQFVSETNNRLIQAIVALKPSDPPDQSNPPNDIPALTGLPLGPPTSKIIEHRAKLNARWIDYLRRHSPPLRDLSDLQIQADLLAIGL